MSIARLNGIWGRIAPSTVQAGRAWYDGARLDCRVLSTDLGYSLEVVAGVVEVIDSAHRSRYSLAQLAETIARDFDQDSVLLTRETLDWEFVQGNNSCCYG